METIDNLLRTNFDVLQYAIFFGALLLLGLAEAAFSRSKKSPRRGLRWPVNFGITALNIMLLSALPVSGLMVADYAQTNSLGLLNVFPLMPLAGLVLGILARSLIGWTTHYAMHKVPVLWRVHRVHHSDTHLDISTTVRFHPLEFLINTPILVVSVLAIGISPVAVLLYELLDAALAAITHANVGLPGRLDRTLQLVFVTPDMHRIHHSSHHLETDSNYGATLSIWDRLFGTYRHKSGKDLASMELGLRECQDDRSRSALWLLKLPFSALRIESSLKASDRKIQQGMRQH
jgi:sterol desaturase/sphingolipid hydroxylase (fatty acid hydroxylase superfamily)